MHRLYGKSCDKKKENSPGRAHRTRQLTMKVKLYGYNATIADPLLEIKFPHL